MSAAPDLRQAEEDLVDAVAGFQTDPLGWVYFAYPWGEGELKDEAGPRDWQIQALTDLRDGLQAGHDLGHMLPILLARASGHGIGKSAFLAWIIDWALSTMEDTRAVVTANTESQLRTKTWPEILKWRRLSITAHWFKPTATAIFSVDPARMKSWRCDYVTWSENNTEAFAGLHNKRKRILVVFDEASAIADKVWEVTEGALTDEDTEIIWCAFGNPTQNTGRFRECFGRLKHRWKTGQIDSRTVPGTNKAQIQAWVDDYGEDSDFVRVRVKGQFPRAGSMQLIPSDVIEEATKREAASTIYDPLIMGVDVSRFGDDKSVIRFRRGRDGRSIKPIKLRGVDTMQLAGRVASLIEEHQPDAVFVDVTGVGGGVVDRLHQLGHTGIVIGVNFGSKADGPVGGEKVANKAAEIWVKGREWLKTGGAIDDDNELRQDMEGRQYGYDADNAVQLEKKDDMKKRGLQSPDDADAFFLTFSHPVSKRPPTDRQRFGSGTRNQLKTDYDPFAA